MSHLVKSFLSVIKLRLQLKGSLFHDQSNECSFWKSFNFLKAFLVCLLNAIYIAGRVGGLVNTSVLSIVT